MEILKLIAIKTDKGYYITDNIKNLNFFETIIGRLKFDWEQPKATFHKHWFIIIKEPSRITEEILQPDINRRYELKDKKQFPNLLEVYKEEDVLIEEGCSENDYTPRWDEKFDEIKSLYDFKSDKQKPIDKLIEFEFEVIGEMKSIPGKTPFEYEVLSEVRDHGEERFYNITNNDIVRNLVDKITTPPILIHIRPCHLTSHDSYKIVRQYIKQNINLNVAKITSDYDFCFTVQKVIQLAEEQKYTVDVNQWSKRKPRYVTRYRTNREVVIFEMGWSPKCYQGYTSIEGFKGKDEKDLKGNIDRFLLKLITDINEPLKECVHCKGRGVIVKEGETKSELI